MNFKKILMILLIISIAFSFFTIIERFNIEKDYKNMEIIIDYDEINELSKFSNEDVEEWLKFFKNNKMTRVSLQEETLKTLIESGENLEAEITYNIKKNYTKLNSLPSKIREDINNSRIKDYDLIVALYDKDIYKFVLNGLKERYNNEFYKTYMYDDKNYIVLRGDIKEVLFEETEKYIDYKGDPYIEEQEVYSSKLSYIGIDYDESKIEHIKNSGLSLLLRPINYKPYSNKIAKNYIKEINEYNADKDLIIFHGKSIIGYPDGYKTIYDFIEKEKSLIVLIETAVQRGHIEQDGINELIYSTDYRGIRGFSVWDYIRERYGEYNYENAEEIENSLYRAITERNIRLIYFKPYMTEKNIYLTDKQIYQESFDRLYQRIEEHNISIGKVEDLENNEISNIQLFIMFINIIIIMMYLLKSEFKTKNKFINILGILGIVFSLALLIYNKSIAGKLFALASSIIYAGLIIDYMIKKINKIKNKKIGDLLIKNTKYIFIIFTLSIIGGLITTSFLSNTKYLLEIDIFRGVKVSQLIPIFILTIFYIQRTYNKKNNSLIYKKILNSEVKIYYMIFFITVSIIGYYYISRTGHESNVEPLQIEMIFRNFLESNLIARPRTKEFLFAAPSFAAAVFFKSRKQEILTFIFLLGAVTGITSIINTFTHIRTPLYLSISRSVFSIFFSIITGAVTIIILIILENFIKSIKEKHNEV